MKISGIVLGIAVGVIMWLVTDEVIYFGAALAIGIAFNLTTDEKK